MKFKIEITNACMWNCRFCYNKNYNKSEETYIDIKKLLIFFEFHRDQIKSHRLAIMGGEPLMHPNIEDLLKYSINKFSSISLFTNTNTIVKEDNGWIVNYLKYLTIIINGNNINIDLLDYFEKNKSSYSINYVIENDIEIMEKKIDMLDSVLKKSSNIINITLSPDVSINIADQNILKQYKLIFPEYLKRMIALIKYYGKSFSVDHSLPICFFSDEMLLDINRFIDVQSLRGCRNTRMIESLYIDPWLNIFNCSNYRTGSWNLFENNKPIRFEKINEIIDSFIQERIIHIEKNTMCQDCKYKIYCNYGCYAHQYIRGEKYNGCQN